MAGPGSAVYLQGEDMSVSIGTGGTYPPNTVYSVKKFSIKGTCQELELPNSVGRPGNPNYPTAANVPVNPPGGGAPGGWMNVTYGLAKCKITLDEACFDQANNLFVTFGVSLFMRMFISLYVFPGQNPVRAHLFPSCLITGISHEGEVGQLQPVSLELTVDGPFLLYGFA